MIRVMKGLPRGLEHWTWETVSSTRGQAGRVWHVDNERHVQTLLWLALAPGLPGLEWEAVVPSAGLVQPRADFALPALHLAIEVKVVRIRADFKRINEEVAADCSLYTATQSPYKRVVVFVWDESRSTELYETFARGLRDLEGVVDAVVAPRPAAWVDPDH